MRIPLSLAKSLAIAGLCSALIVVPRYAAGQDEDSDPSAAEEPAQSPPPSTPPPQNSEPQVIESAQGLGTFAIGGQAYTVVTRVESLAGKTPKDAKLKATVGSLQINDAAGNIVYQETFPYERNGDHFASKLSASASLLSTTSGAALAIRFVDEPGSATTGESWEVFGMTGGKLVSWGAPLPLGQGGGISVGGVVTGVMLRGGIGVVPLASTADELEFRAWAGNFFVFVPVNVDWVAGQWSQGEECFELNEGSLRPKGCNLHVAASPQPPEEGATVELSADTVEDRYDAQEVPLQSNSQVEFLLVRALVKWGSVGDRITCSLDDLWLRVRIDGKEGWVHSQEGLAALGLPAAPSPQ
jgi:hypothetical protein